MSDIFCVYKVFYIFFFSFFLLLLVFYSFISFSHPFRVAHSTFWFLCQHKSWSLLITAIKYHMWIQWQPFLTCFNGFVLFSIILFFSSHHLFADTCISCCSAFKRFSGNHSMSTWRSVESSMVTSTFSTLEFKKIFQKRNEITFLTLSASIRMLIKF